MPVDDGWDNIINEKERERFVGREQELEVFRAEINRISPNYLIYYITGPGGVGKTLLLNRYQEIAKNFGFLLAGCDQEQRDVPAVLGHFARQLERQNFPLKRFNRRYETYRQKMDEIQSDPEAPQGLPALVGRTIVRVGYVVGDALPVARKALDLMPQEPVETQASEWLTYLAKKISNKDDVSLVREPISILTRLFFEDLNEIVQERRILLCFENFQATRQELQEWFLRVLEYKPSRNIRIAIASRDQPGTQWDTLKRITTTIRLDVFTEQEAEALLSLCNITDPKQCKAIIKYTGKLPVLLGWIAESQSKEPITTLPVQNQDSSIPTSDIVEWFLREVTEPALREVVVLAAIPRIFNADILELLLEGNGKSIDAQAAFDWLVKMSFIRQHPKGWQYHDVVRRIMLQYLRQKSPLTYRKMYSKLADFSKAVAVRSSNDKP
jgi:hypothetical protein